MIPAAIELTHRNTRRYGGYLVHMGIVLMFIGYTGRGVQSGHDQGSGAGRHFRTRATTICSIVEHEQGENDNYAWQQADGGSVAQRKSLGHAGAGAALLQSQPAADFRSVHPPAAERRSVHLNFAGLSTDNQRAVIQAYVFPLVSWIWIGFWVLAFGTLVCLIPNKVRLSYARTQVVGVAEKHATVEN